MKSIAGIIITAALSLAAGTASADRWQGSSSSPTYASSGDYVWVDGAWQASGDGWTWIAGHYERARVPMARHHDGDGDRDDYRDRDRGDQDRGDRAAAIAATAATAATTATSATAATATAAGSATVGIATAVGGATAAPTTAAAAITATAAVVVAAVGGTDADDRPRLRALTPEASPAIAA